MKQWILLFFVLVLPLIVIAQVKDTDCPKFNEYIENGKKALAAGKSGGENKFIAAINAFSAAMIHCPERSKEAGDSILLVFTAIENLRIAAKKAAIAEKVATKKAEIDRDTAEAALTREKHLKVQIKIEKDSAQIQKQRAEDLAKKEIELRIVMDTLYKVVKSEKANTQTKNEELNKLVNAFYFYDNKLALAYKNDKFGFINKEGVAIIDYQYDKAEQFQHPGFAKVKIIKIKEGDKIIDDYLIDPFGRKYKVVYGRATVYKFVKNLLLPIAFVKRRLQRKHGVVFENKITPDVTAWDFRETYVGQFPKSILKQKQLRVVILDGDKDRAKGWKNKIEKIPPKIKALDSLEVLSLSYCQITQLPNEIGDLPRLKKLILSDNQLKCLPKGIGNADSLEYLNVSNNFLDSLPDEISKLKNLKYLDLRNNPIPASEYERIRKLVPWCEVSFDATL